MKDAQIDKWSGLSALYYICLSKKSKNTCLYILTYVYYELGSIHDHFQSYLWAADVCLAI